MKNILILLIIIILLISGTSVWYHFFSQKNYETKTNRKIENLESEKIDLENHIIDLEEDKADIEFELKKAIDSIENYTPVQTIRYIEKRYELPPNEQTGHVIDSTGDVSLIVHEDLAKRVVKDLATFDATEDLLSICNHINSNLAQKLKLTKEQLDLSEKQASKFKKQRDIYSIPIIGNVLAFPNFIKNL